MPTQCASWLSDLPLHLLQDSQTREWMLQDEEETFVKYANVCIDEWARQGKATKPMELHMHKLKRHAKSVTR